MRVSLVQVASPADEGIAERRTRVADVVRRAPGSELVVLPELWASGYFEFDSYDRDAETLTGPTVTWGRELARELGSHLHLGSVLLRGDGRGITNTALLVDPHGNLVHRYDKIHVFGYQSREAELLEPGHSVSVVQAPWGPTAATTCYDLRFPELWRRLLDIGAETVVVPAAWPAARLAHWQLFTSARAVEEQVFILACNAVGTQRGDVVLAGHSRIVDPWGVVVAEGGDEECTVTADIDPAVVQQTRQEFGVTRDRVEQIDHQPLEMETA